MVLDVAVNHEFGGDDLADVSRNGALRDAQPDRILENTARTKVARYRAGYSALKYAFLPCVISGGGRLPLPPPLHRHPSTRLDQIESDPSTAEDELACAFSPARFGGQHRFEGVAREEGAQWAPHPSVAEERLGRYDNEGLRKGRLSCLRST